MAGCHAVLTVRWATQEFRIVDHVEFETGSMVDNFLQAWRSTGHQRFGYLYGRYVPYAEVPLGIKAQVAFIYEVCGDQGTAAGGSGSCCSHRWSTGQVAFV